MKDSTAAEKFAAVFYINFCGIEYVKRSWLMNFLKIGINLIDPLR